LWISLIVLLCRKSSKNEDGESVIKEAIENARLWEARFGAADKSRQEYRQNAKKLLTQNERLQKAVEEVS